MLGRKNVYAIINEINSKLNGYLNNHSHEILTERELKAGFYTTGTDEYGRCVRTHQDYSSWARCNDGNYIVFKYKLSDRNSLLTLDRMKNIYNIRKELNDHLVSMREEKQDELNKRIDQIYELLETGVTNNKQLSIDYGVTHITYEDSRLAGHGIFASRCNATWTQSRAGRALEKSLSLLDDFKRTFGQTMPKPSAPPQYLESIETNSVSVVSAKKV